MRLESATHTHRLNALCLIGLMAAACGPETAGAPALPSFPGVTAGSAAPAIPPPATLPTTGAAAAAAPGAPASMAPTGAAGGPAVVAPTAPVTPPAGATAADAMWCGVKRTLDSNCTVCHNEQKTAGAPMSLKTHADLLMPAVSDATKKVYQLVGTRVHDKMKPMPPQGKLTADQLTGIDTWVAAGAPAGTDPTCAADGPPPKTSNKAEWPTNCDDTFTVLIGDGAPNSVPAGQEVHPQFQVTPPWGNEEVQAIAWRAKVDNAKVLHHWILYGSGGEFLFGWAPGKDINEPLPPDVGVYLPSTPMRMDVHYNNVQGKSTEMDKSGVEICVLRKANFRPKTATTSNGLTSMLISVPPRAVDFDVTGTCTHSGSPVHILSASPHAHRTAHHMKFTVEKASGETIVMHDQDFNFEEQTTYPMNPPIEIVSGDRIITTCTFTNDTDATITFGENTGNEMCFNFALYEPMGGLSCGFGGGGFPRF